MAATQKACPANHLDAYRAYFRKSDQDVRHVSERYIVKPDPFIVMVSTPYTPDGLFDIREGTRSTTIILEYTSHITAKPQGKN